jgi:hypothetical protein
MNIASASPVVERVSFSKLNYFAEAHHAAIYIHPDYNMPFGYRDVATPVLHNVLLDGIRNIRALWIENATISVCLSLAQCTPANRSFASVALRLASAILIV